MPEAKSTTRTSARVPYELEAQEGGESLDSGPHGPETVRVQSGSQLGLDRQSIAGYGPSPEADALTSDDTANKPAQAGPGISPPTRGRGAVS